MDSPLAHISLDSSGIWGIRKPVLACGRIHTCKWRETDTELISYAIAQIKMNVIISIKMKSIFEKRWKNDPSYCVKSQDQSIVSSWVLYIPLVIKTEIAAVINAVHMHKADIWMASRALINRHNSPSGLYTFGLSNVHGDIEIVWHKYDVWGARPQYMWKTCEKVHAIIRQRHPAPSTKPCHWKWFSQFCHFWRRGSSGCRKINDSPKQQACTWIFMWP